MDMLLILLMVFAAVVLIGYPLINARRYRYAGDMLPGAEHAENLCGERDRIFDALRDLQLEYATGKISDGDYQMLRTHYDVKAVEVLQQLDALTGQRKSKIPEGLKIPEGWNDAGNGNSGGGNGSGKGDLDAPAKRTVAANKHCPACRAPVHGRDTFCAECGAKLS